MRTWSVMWVKVRMCRCVCESACGRGANLFFCLYSSRLRAYVTQCALVVAGCSTSWWAFRSIRQSASFQSYCSSILSVLALGPTVILRVYSRCDLGPKQVDCNMCRISNCSSCLPFVWHFFYCDTHTHSLSLSLSHTHTHAHTQTRACIHACVCALAHSCKLMCVE